MIPQPFIAFINLQIQVGVKELWLWVWFFLFLLSLEQAVVWDKELFPNKPWSYIRSIRSTDPNSPFQKLNTATRLCSVFFSPPVVSKCSFLCMLFYASWKPLLFSPAVLEKQGLCTRKKLKYFLLSPKEKEGEKVGFS